MYYITHVRSGPHTNVPYNVEEIMNILYGNQDLSAVQEVHYSPRYFVTHTIQVADGPPMWPDRIALMNRKLKILSDKCRAFENPEGQYDFFQIPKHSGGFRTISAPTVELKALQRKIVEFLRDDCQIKVHDCAFAYTSGRCHQDAVVRHQQNRSRWFLKLDIQDFFPSTNFPFIITQLRKIYPLNYLDEGDLTQMLRVCMLNGGLPQGSPASPILTNLLMVPIDYAINKVLWDYNKSHYVYTRYADDMTISNRFSFKFKEIQGLIQQILRQEGSPYLIKAEKTHYGSSAGRNWVLGLMLNQHNQVTVGHKRKERMRAMVHDMFTEYSNGGAYSVEDLQILLGNLAYIDKVEPGYQRKLIQKYEARHPEWTLERIKKETFN